MVLLLRLLKDRVTSCIYDIKHLTNYEQQKRRVQYLINFGSTFYVSIFFFKLKTCLSLINVLPGK